MEPPNYMLRRLPYPPPVAQGPLTDAEQGTFRTAMIAVGVIPTLHLAYQKVLGLRVSQPDVNMMARWTSMIGQERNASRIQHRILKLLRSYVRISSRTYNRIDQERQDWRALTDQQKRTRLDYVTQNYDTIKNEVQARVDELSQADVSTAPDSDGDIAAPEDGQPDPEPQGGQQEQQGGQQGGQQNPGPQGGYQDQPYIGAWGWQGIQRKDHRGFELDQMRNGGDYLEQFERTAVRATQAHQSVVRSEYLVQRGIVAANQLLTTYHVRTTPRMFGKRINGSMGYVAEDGRIRSGEGLVNLRLHVVNGYIYTNLVLLEAEGDPRRRVKRQMLILNKSIALVIKRLFRQANEYRGIFAARLIDALMRYNQFARAVGSVGRLVNKFPDIIANVHADQYQILQQVRNKAKLKGQLRRANKILVSQNKRPLGNGGTMADLQQALQQRNAAAVNRLEQFVVAQRQRLTAGGAQLVQTLQQAGANNGVWREKLKFPMLDKDPVIGRENYRGQVWGYGNADIDQW